MDWQTIVKDNNLDVSVINSSDLNEDIRFEAEFYRPEFIQIENLLKKRGVESYGSFIKNIQCGPFGSTILSDSYVESGAYLARPFNLRNCVITDDNRVYISEEDLKNKKLNEYNNGDIFFSRVGEIACSLVWGFGEKDKVTISPNIIAVKTDTKKLSPFYTVIFFETKYGKGQMLRAQKVVAQPTISTQLIKSLLIPIPSINLQNSIEKIYRAYVVALKKSADNYREAEKLFLKEIGLFDYEVGGKNISIRNFIDCLIEDRFDAEYWQPKYDEMFCKIREKPYKKIGDIANVETGQYISEYVEKGADTKSFIRGTDVSQYEIDTNSLLFVRVSDQKKKHVAKKDDVVVARVGSIGLCARIQDNLVGSTISDNLIAIRTKADIEMSSYYLTVYLNSFVGQEFMKRLSRGSVQQRLNQETLKELPVPILDIDIQYKIEKMVIDGHLAKNEAKDLFEKAKRAVEIFIEQDEEKALSFIQ